jgi:hypothetical protein
VRKTASCAGVGSTSSASSPRGSASTFIPAMSGSCCRSSASPTSVGGPVIQLKTSGPSRLSKKLPARGSKAHVDGLPETTPVEIWFEDEARIGQKNGQVRQWARRGTRPRQPADQRYDNAYLFGAICPARGVGAAFVLPYADADMMQLHLDEISRNVAEGAHAVLLLDRAGWHTTGKLDVPDKHHADLPAFPRPGAEPGRERLAVSPPELALKHRLRRLRRDRRRRMRRLAKAHRSTRNNHLHRNVRLGSRRSDAMTVGIIFEESRATTAVAPTHGSDHRQAAACREFEMNERARA